MSVYDARLQIEGEFSPPTDVLVDLTRDRHLKMSIGDHQVADWARDEMRISAQPDGFHIRAKGESIILDVSDDARFAIELGLRNAHPHLRQRMSALMRSGKTS
ncbi:MAG TPA: hypothetical protein VE569_09950 [Acidimicrobiia bacterium]|jgi:hypothetical protein|nr:hypothetical protein [Acidimicrobiia bacterium]